MTNINYDVFQLTLNQILLKNTQVTDDTPLIDDRRIIDSMKNELKLYAIFKSHKEEIYYYESV